MDEVKGFKAFNIDSTNRYGKTFTEGETYRVTGDIKFGNNGNGFHMCTVLADVFRYVNATSEDVIVAEVTGRGNRVKRDDNYYGYYDMYSFEEITIDRFLKREEIIERILKSSLIEVKKFLVTCKLSEEEKMLFVATFRDDMEILKTLLYYHFGCTTVYEKDNGVTEIKKLRLVLNDGQDSNKGSKRK